MPTPKEQLLSELETLKQEGSKEVTDFNKEKQYEPIGSLKTQDSIYIQHKIEIETYNATTDRIRALSELYVMLNSQEDEHKQLESQVIKSLKELI